MFDFEVCVLHDVHSSVFHQQLFQLRSQGYSFMSIHWLAAGLQILEVKKDLRRHHVSF